MKKMKYVIIGVLIVGLVVGYYAYYTHEKSKKEEVELSEVQKIILKDLSGKSYPATPREVVKFYNRIIACYYNEEFTEEELHQLTDQARALMDNELADNNPSEQYYQRVAGEVQSYRDDKLTITNVNISDSNDIQTIELDGKDCAYVNASYLVRKGSELVKTNQSYILRKDDEGKWRILAFELVEGE